MGPKRDWSDVEIENTDPCLICGIQGRTTRAHVSGRRFDRPKPGRKTLWVNPLDVVPLCGPVGDSQACHTLFDAGEVDLLPYLADDLARQLRCVEIMGGIEAARRRLAPSDYSRRIVQAREDALLEAA